MSAFAQFLIPSSSKRALRHVGILFFRVRGKGKGGTLAVIK